MTQEEKELLLKDLCARLPYVVIVNFTLGDISFNERVSSVDINKGDVQVYVKQGTLMCPLKGDQEIKLSQVKPYLRPLSSMTEEEKSELQNKFCYGWNYKDEGIWDLFNHHKIYGADAELLIDWLNEHHFDYRGLIEKGLALEATEDMYKNE